MARSQSVLRGMLVACLSSADLKTIAVHFGLVPSHAIGHIGAAQLAPVVLRAWGDRRAAALTTVLFQLAPLPFATLANANLTNVFGQSMALAAIAAAATWPLDVRRYRSLLGLTALTTWAFCPHVSTVTMLSATLGVLAIAYLWRSDPERRRAALAIVVATAIVGKMDPRNALNSIEKWRVLVSAWSASPAGVCGGINSSRPRPINSCVGRPLNLADL